jgi:hypothetical protein
MLGMLIFRDGGSSTDDARSSLEGKCNSGTSVHLALLNGST